MSTERKANPETANIMRKFRVQSLWRGCTNDELAEDLGMSRGDITQYRHNKRQFIKNATAEKMLEWLDTLPFRPVDDEFKAVVAVDGVFIREPGSMERLNRYRRVHEKVMAELRAQHIVDGPDPVIPPPGEAVVEPDGEMVLSESAQVAQLNEEISQLRRKLADTEFILEAVRAGRIQ